jgi:hypothetical protein
METILQALIPRGDSRMARIINWTLVAAFGAAVAAAFFSSDASAGFSGTVFTR